MALGQAYLNHSGHIQAWLTLQQRVESSRCGQVGCYGNIFLIWRLYLDVDWAVRVAAEAADLPRRERDIGQAAETVIPKNEKL